MMITTSYILSQSFEFPEANHHLKALFISNLFKTLPKKDHPLIFTNEIIILN